MFALLTDLILAICTCLCFSARPSAVLDEPPIPPSAAAEETPVSSQCCKHIQSTCTHCHGKRSIVARDNDGTDVSLTVEESKTADACIREGKRREAHTDRENITEPGQTHILSTECRELFLQYEIFGF